MDVRHDIFELARFLTELSVIDYFFVIHRPSIVAYAALVNAMEDIPGAHVGLREFMSEVSKFSHLQLDSEAFRACRNRLRLLYSQGSYSRTTPTILGYQDEMITPRGQSISPVCVSYGCQTQYFTQGSHDNMDDY